MAIISFCTYLLDDSLLFIETFFWTRFQFTGQRTANFSSYGFTFGVWGRFLHWCWGDSTHLIGPFGTFFCCGIPLGYGLTLYLVFCFTFNNIISNIMDMVGGDTDWWIFGSTYGVSLTWNDWQTVRLFLSISQLIVGFIPLQIKGVWQNLMGSVEATFLYSMKQDLVKVSSQSSSCWGSKSVT